MNVYVWTGSGVLTGYRNGMVVAVAENIERAREIVRKRLLMEVYDYYFFRPMTEDNLDELLNDLDDFDRDDLNSRLEFLKSEPVSLGSQETVIYVRGGD